MYLLDTNVLSDLRRPKFTNEGLASWAGRMAHEDMYLSVMTLMELEVGTLLIARRDKTQGGILRAWIDDQVLPQFGRRIIPVDTAVAQRCAALHVPDRRPERDALIAATAMVHRMRVVTRNVADFEPMGVDLFNPWV
jgi:predicted nucleic acid-binding protein